MSRFGRRLFLAMTLAAANGCGRADTETGAESTLIVRTSAPDTATLTADPFRITSSGIGAVRIGMTLNDARQALPGAVFQRTSDGEGIALVQARFASDTAAKLTLWADEDDAEQPVDWSKRIRGVETFSPAFRTEAGVHPGSLISDVEKVYGKVREITLSEIESRQYVEFESQPAGLTFRIDYTGVFKTGSRTTTAYASGAKIHSIAIQAP